MRTRAPESTGGEAPVFVCGLARSGTTWIADALGQSPELENLREAWLIAKLEELTDWFTKIREDSDSPWSRSGVDRQLFVERLAAWYLELLTLAAGGRRFVEKTPHWNAKHVLFLHELFPDAYYLLVYRDGRNTTASWEAFMAKRGQAVDFAAECRRWANGMDLFQRVRDEEPIRRSKLVRYEDLVADADAVFVDVCRFVGVAPFSPRPHQANTSFPAKDDASDFNERWHSWSEERRATFKRIAGRQLVAWGYVESNDAW